MPLDPTHDSRKGSELLPAPDAPESAPDDVQAMAVFVPNIARSLLRVAGQRGYSLAPFCRGLGFRLEDCLSGDLRLSYKQMRDLISRVLQRVNDPTLGIVTGACQTPLSLGPVGLGLLTCKTLGDALVFGLRHQAIAGAMVEHLLIRTEQTISLEISPKYPDPLIEDFLVTQSFASVLALGRSLANNSLKPVHIELSSPPNDSESAYSDFFRCQIVFNRRRNLMVFDQKWLDYQLPNYDPFTCETLQRNLVSSFPVINEKHELISSLTSLINHSVDCSALQNELASAINMSDRTMRRRLKELGTNFRQVAQKARHEQSIKLLQCFDKKISDISEELGYSNVRAFRRAFQRWTGVLPTEFRASLKAQRGLKGAFPADEQD